MAESNHPIRVALVDDQKVLVEALKLVISAEADLLVVGEAASSGGCVGMVERVHPEVLLLEINLPDGDGLELISQIKRACVDTKVVVLTGQCSEATLLQAVEKGASGFTCKERGLAEVLAMIRKAAAGEKAIPINLLLEMLHRRVPATSLSTRRDEVQEQRRLTRREREILTCLAQGQSGAEIAAQLGLSPQTVRTFIRNILEKLEVHSRMEAVTLALRRGLIHPQE